jgi:Xaa-Pro aminopeptidase
MIAATATAVQQIPVALRQYPQEDSVDRRDFEKGAIGAVQTSAVAVPRSIAQLPSALRALLDQTHPKFSDAEYARRQRLLGGVMENANVDHLVLVTWQRIGNANEWLTAWPGWTETITVFKPGERMTMFVEYFNHIPQARRMARDCDVHWCEEEGIRQAIGELKRRGAKRVGVIGPLLVPRFRQLEDAFPAVVLDGEYTRLRLFEKSEEELDWMRLGSALSDAGFSNLVRETRVGMTEFELANLVERAYVPFGGAHGIHFIGVTSMASPDVVVPMQFHRQRRVQAGDVVFCEITSSFWGYSGQVLRTFTVEAEPTPLFRDLHATAEAAFDAITAVIRPGATLEDMIEATSVVEKSGFSTCDDVVHGYGGGYFQPIIGSKSRPAATTPKMALRENMCMVVQPNVINREHTAGVQVGEVIRVTKTGFESMHNMPRGLFCAGQSV